MVLTVSLEVVKTPADSDNRGAPGNRDKIPGQRSKHGSQSYDSASGIDMNSEAFRLGRLERHGASAFIYGN